jgi:hypothetical protein
MAAAGRGHCSVVTQRIDLIRSSVRAVQATRQPQRRVPHLCRTALGPGVGGDQTRCSGPPHAMSSSTWARMPEWRLANSQVHRPRPSRSESSSTSSRAPDTPTSGMHAAQWALPSARLEESSHATKRRRSSPGSWTQSLTGVLPLRRRRGGNRLKSKWCALCLRNSSLMSFVVAGGLPSSPPPRRTGMAGGHCHLIPTDCDAGLPRRPNIPSLYATGSERFNSLSVLGWRTASGS